MTVPRGPVGGCSAVLEGERADRPAVVWSPAGARSAALPIWRGPFAGSDARFERTLRATKPLADPQGRPYPHADADRKCPATSGRSTTSCGNKHAPRLWWPRNAAGRAPRIRQPDADVPSDATGTSSRWSISTGFAVVHAAPSDSPPNRRVTVAFDANNPGYWALHCPPALPPGRGMFTTLKYV